MRRKRLLWVEVEDFTENESFVVSRNDAKHNLHMVCELTQNDKTYTSMFDKIWYQSRENDYLQGRKESSQYIFSNDQFVRDQQEHYRMPKEGNPQTHEHKQAAEEAKSTEKQKQAIKTLKK